MAPRIRRSALAAILVPGLLVACSAPGATGSPAISISDAASSLASASASASPPSVAYPRSLTDDAGREVTLDAAPERIVSLAPSNTEIVCALDACDRLVGVTDFDDYPEEIADVPDVVLQAQVDVERVVGAEPDLVLAAGNEITPTAVIDQLDGLGLTVLVVYPETLDEVYADIELIAAALDVAPAAEGLVTTMRARVDEINLLVADADAPRVLYEVFHAEGSTYTAGEGSFLASLIELAGGEPVVGDAQGVLSAEDLVSADPQLILLGTASYDPELADPGNAAETVAARPGWAGLSAVQDGRVVPYLSDIVTTRPGPRIVDGLEALARAIHPGEFH